MSFKELVHFMYVIKFMGLGLFIMFFYYALHVRRISSVYFSFISGKSFINSKNQTLVLLIFSIDFVFCVSLI